MDFYTFTTQLIAEAGEFLLIKRNEVFSVGFKNENRKDTVTSVDIEMGEFITSRIRAMYPEHAIYSEEAKDISGNQYQWVIDPIDGSAVFARGIPQYAISIGLLKQGVPIVGAVLDPVANELFSFADGKGVFLNGTAITVSKTTDVKSCFTLFAAGRKDEQREWAGESYKTLLGSVNKTKNFGSSALSLCYIASGRIEAVIAGTFTTMDIAAAVGILRAAGGVITDAEGNDARLLKDSQRIYAANSQQVNSEIISLLELE